MPRRTWLDTSRLLFTQSWGGGSLLVYWGLTPQQQPGSRGSQGKADSKSRPFGDVCNSFFTIWLSTDNALSSDRYTNLYLLYS